MCDRSIFSPETPPLHLPPSLFPAAFAELETLIHIGLRGFRDEVSLLCATHCVCVYLGLPFSLPPSVDSVKYALGSIILNSPRNSI